MPRDCIRNPGLPSTRLLIACHDRAQRPVSDIAREKTIAWANPNGPCLLFRTRHTPTRCDPNERIDSIFVACLSSCLTAKLWFTVDEAVRRPFLSITKNRIVACIALILVLSGAPARGQAPVCVENASLSELRDALLAGRVTSSELTRAY